MNYEAFIDSCKKSWKMDFIYHNIVLMKEKGEDKYKIMK